MINVGAKSKIRTITLTDRAPVRVSETDWPIIASVKNFDGELECQANQEWRITVREHSDGRRIVYGYVDRGNGGMPVSYRGVYAGYLLAPSEDTIDAIRKVAEAIGDEQLGQDCIADLPAEEL